GVLERADHNDRFATRPALVGVQAQPRLGPDRLTHAADPFDVTGSVGADLDLEYVEPVRDPRLAGLGQRVRVTDRQRDVRTDHVDGRAEEAVQRLPTAPGREVVQRDVDRVLRGEVADRGTLHATQRLGEVVRAEAVE